MFRNVHTRRKRDIIILNKDLNEVFMSELFNQIGSDDQRQELLTRVYEHSSKGNNRR